jgi:hypothetical protein
MSRPRSSSILAESVADLGLAIIKPVFVGTQEEPKTYLSVNIWDTVNSDLLNY